MSRRDPGPQPLQHGIDAPAGLVDRDDRTAADGGAQSLIGRLRLARGAVDGVDQPAARDRQAEAVAQQRGDLAVGQPEPFIEQDREARRPAGRAAPPRRRAHPTSAADGGLARGGRQLAAPADVARERRARSAAARAALPDIASRSGRGAPAPSQCGHCDGSGAVVGLIDVRGAAAVGAHAIGGAGLATRPPRLRDARAAGERRRLAIDGAARRIELLFQFLVFAPQPLALGFRPTQILAQLLDLAASARR